MRKIAAKVAKRIQKAQAAKVVDLSSYRQLKKETEDQFNQLVTAESAITSGLDPLHAVYLQAQNLLSVLIEALQNIPEPALSRFFNTIAAAEDSYLPQGPPISPLTASYFNCWLLFDLSVGLDKETLTTLIIDLAKPLGLHPNMVNVMRALQDSRMGIYEFMGQQDDKLMLRELSDHNTVPCICPTGYQGTQVGELWFVRILPPVLGLFDYSIVFITPYVLLHPDKAAWEAYLTRTVGDKKTMTTANSLQNLMKNGLSDNYWNEYIFQSYFNHQSDVIYLQGLPDVSSSRPHCAEAAHPASLLPDSPLA